MKLTSFTTLSIVATCLSGGVWATGGLSEAECELGFCKAMECGDSPEKYDNSFPLDKLKKLRQLTNPIEIKKLSDLDIEERKELSEVDIEKLKELSDKEIAGAAKVYLLDKTYLETALISKDEVTKALQENSSESSYRYYMTVSTEEYDIIQIHQAIKVEVYSKAYEGLGLNFTRLRMDNPVEAKAAYFIRLCYG
ncbi:hypothetical protein IWQ61_003355 [Dispira simplex]|nr:hypothetical protein IWQ61_003355 [Dispira simplex]